MRASRGEGDMFIDNPKNRAWQTRESAVAVCAWWPSQWPEIIDACQCR